LREKERLRMELYTFLFAGGVVLMGGAVVAAVITGIVLGVSGKRLKAQLEKEYGLRRRRR